MLRRHALIAAVFAALPVLSLALGAGGPTFSMYSASVEFKLELRGHTPSGATREVPPSSLAARLPESARPFVSGADHFRRTYDVAVLRRHLEDLARLSCQEDGSLDEVGDRPFRTNLCQNEADRGARPVRSVSADRPLDARFLGIARIALGAVFVVRTTPLVNALPMPLAHVRGPLFGWPDPGWPMAWGGFSLPDPVREAACVVRTVAAVLFLLGFRARLAGTLAGALGLLALSQDPFGFIFTLYTLFLGTLVLAWTDATSVLAWRPEAPSDPRSSATLVTVVVASIYGWSGLAKAQGEWLSGGTLLALSEDGLFTPKVASLLRGHAALRVGAAWGAIATELGLCAALLFFCFSPVSSRFPRPPPVMLRSALLVALSMHLVFEVAARPDVMGGVMASLLVACAARA